MVDSYCETRYYQFIRSARARASTLRYSCKHLPSSIYYVTDNPRPSLPRILALTLAGGGYSMEAPLAVRDRLPSIGAAAPRVPQSPHCTVYALPRSSPPPKPLAFAFGNQRHTR